MPFRVDTSPRAGIVPVGDRVAGVAAISVEAAPPRWVILISLAVTPSQGVFDGQVWIADTVEDRARSYGTHLALVTMHATLHVAGRCRGCERKCQRKRRRRSNEPESDHKFLLFIGRINQ